MMRTILLDAPDVSVDDIDRMVRLMQRYYENVTAEQFAADLRKKDGVLVLRDDEKVCGFSTLVLLNFAAGGQPIRVMFSGDTVMDDTRRNSVELPFGVARAALARLRQAPHVPLYWLLTSKGYKTFRSLPVFFRSFHPWPGREPSPLERAVLREAAARLFNGRLDSERWIIRARDGDQRLRPGVADITDRLRRRPDIAYFERMNPGHARGDELVCLAKFDEHNVRPLILRKLEAHDDP
jgi:hypothetical protein